MMDMQNLLANLKQYPVAVGAVILTILLAVALYVRKGGIPDMETQQTELKEKVDTFEGNAEEAIDLETHTEMMQDLASEIDSRTMLRAELTKNVAYFYGFEREDALEINSITQVPQGNLSRVEERAAEKQRYETINFTIQVEGTYKNLIRFAHDLRNGEKIVRVEDMGITPAGSNTNPELLQATFSVNALGRKVAQNQPANT